jgi:hypothetical protein
MCLRKTHTGVLELVPGERTWGLVGTYEKLRTLYFIEEFMFARLEVPTAVLLKIRIF